MEKSGYKKILYAFAIILIFMAIVYTFLIAPIPAAQQRGMYQSDASWLNTKFSYHISYFHIPIAITAYIAFLLVLVFSILYLKDKQQQWDIKAAASAEVGVIFAGLTLITGSIWAGATWFHYWPPGSIRLNTSLVLFFIYLAYLMIRQAIDTPEKRARLSAVFGIIGFISVPISFLSIRIWSEAYHPTVFGPGGGGMQGIEIIFPMVLNLTAYILMCISLIIYKVDNITLQEELMAAKLKKGV